MGQGEVVRTVGLREIDIAEISNPEAFNDRLQEPRIIQRAGSIKDFGMLQEPIVRKSDGRLLTGRDRVAAHVVLGLKSVKVKLVECTDPEAKRIELIENFERRHDADEQARLRKLMLDTYEAEERKKPIKHAKPGRPFGTKTPRGKARERLAREKGINPESVRRAEHRQKAKERKAVITEVAETGKAPMPPAHKDPTINVLGMQLAPEFLAQTEAIQTYITDALAKIRGGRQILTQLRNAELPFSPGLMQRLIDDVEELEGGVKGAKPAAVCPYCKTLSGVQEACNGCATMGWVTAAQLASTPKVLLVEGDGASVQYEGNITLVSDLIDTQAGEPAAESDGVSLVNDDSDPEELADQEEDFFA